MSSSTGMFIFPYSPSMRSYLFGNFEPHLSFDVLSDDEIIDVLNDVNACLKAGATRSGTGLNHQKLKETAPGPQKDVSLLQEDSEVVKRIRKSNVVAPKKIIDNSVDEGSKDQIPEENLMDSFEKTSQNHNLLRPKNSQPKPDVPNDGGFPVNLPPAPEPSFLFSGLGLVVLPILIGTALLILFILRVIPTDYRLLVRLFGLYVPASLATCFIVYLSFRPLNSPTCRWMEEDEYNIIKELLENWNNRKFRRLGFRWSLDIETEAIELNVDANVESLADEVSEVNRKSDRVV
jgi:hypothetical protein